MPSKCEYCSKILVSTSKSDMLRHHNSKKCLLAQKSQIVSDTLELCMLLNEEENKKKQIKKEQEKKRLQKMREDKAKRLEKPILGFQKCNVCGFNYKLIEFERKLKIWRSCNNCSQKKQRQYTNGEITIKQKSKEDIKRYNNDFYYRNKKYIDTRYTQEYYNIRNNTLHQTKYIHVIQELELKHKLIV